MILKEKLKAQLPAWRERVKKLVSESGDVKVDEITVSQVYGGMRNIKGLVTDISYVDPNEGIRLRGFTIPELLEKLPKAPGAQVPLVGGLYYLLLIGEIPTFEEAMEVENEWNKRSEVPDYVLELLRTMPDDTHPMTLFSMSILSLQRDSVFARRYQEGMRKEEYWEAMLEDSLNLTARVPSLAAYVYCRKYLDSCYVWHDPELDLGANFAKMMHVDDPGYADLSRLYFIIHSDHESGNASAHATHLVASTLADVYYAASAAIDALAGPLHGLANQEALAWLLDVHKKFGGVPSAEQLAQFAGETLESGQVIPGYGHAVLRKTDPRYTAQYEFAKGHMANDDIFRLASLVYDVVPDVLREKTRTKDPWPNVDAISGTLQHYYGVDKLDFYTVMFGVSRIMGVSANAVWARALGQPIERPKSVTTEMLEQAVAKAKQAA